MMLFRILYVTMVKTLLSAKAMVDSDLAEDALRKSNDESLTLLSEEARYKAQRRHIKEAIAKGEDPTPSETPSS